MLFNSFEFALFLPIVFSLYWFVFNKNLKLQNLFILIVSYVFYGWWDWRFLSLIVFSSIIDFVCALKIQNSEESNKRKVYLWISMMVNLGFLGVFKYFNFFTESFADLLKVIGFNVNTYTLNFILPVGISFYTFQTMSYTIDVYRKQLNATKDLIAFFAYVSFFPQLVAGPIERAINLLPQFYKPRIFKYEDGVEGLRLILIGLFKKVVVADNCATYVNYAFENYETASGIELILGAVFFAFQIYGDFSGYSDIAIGCAKLFGFDLMINFRTPYFSRDIAEFWRRWHISLTTWFRDYLYIPLGGSRVSKSKAILNTFIIFLVSGFWHGANWTFIVWGFLNALYFVPLLLTNKNRRHLDTVAQKTFLPSLKEIAQISFTFFITCLAWIFFRSQTLEQAFIICGKIFLGKNWVFSEFFKIDLLLISGVLITIEWIGRNKKGALGIVRFIDKKWIRLLFYYLIIMSIILLGEFSNNEFIYFQF